MAGAPPAQKQREFSGLGLVGEVYPQVHHYIATAEDDWSVAIRDDC